MTTNRLPIAACLLLAGLVAPARAQPAGLPTNEVPTNEVVLGRLAVRCFGLLETRLDAAPTVFTLAAPGLAPYLRAALAEHWRVRGYTVYLADTRADTLADTRAADRPVVRIEADDVGVAYARAGRGRLDRTARLGLALRATAPDGRLLADTRCLETTTDAVLRRDVGRLETPALPETQAPLPPGSWRRRYLEPVVLGGAVAVAALLFFSLRSDSSADA